MKHHPVASHENLVYTKIDMLDDEFFVKSYSHGQITIPKAIRDAFQLGTDFWLKMIINSKNQIIVEPVAPDAEQGHSAEYRKKLLGIKGDWYKPQELKNIRQRSRQRLEDLYGEKPTGNL